MSENSVRRDERDLEAAEDAYCFAHGPAAAKRGRQILSTRMTIVDIAACSALCFASIKNMRSVGA